jgi:hypothetical protein
MSRITAVFAKAPLMNVKHAPLLVVVLWHLSALGISGATPGPEDAQRSPLSCFFISPTRVVWHSETGVQHAASLLEPHAGQTLLQAPQPPCVLTASADTPAGILLDFGRELQGYVELFTPMTPEQGSRAGPRPVR